MDDTPYLNDPKDIRDLNQNISLLIQKVNHEQTSMNKDIKTTNKKVAKISDNFDIMSKGFTNHIITSEANSKMLKLILVIIGGVAALISIGAFVSGFR